MTATDLAPRTREHVQALHPHRTQPRTLKVTRIVRRAIEAMVWQGLKRDDAAKYAGMQPNSLYVALRRPDVKALYNTECEVLRLSGRARRITRLEELAEQDDNKQAAINACLALDRVDAEQQQRLGAPQVAGFVIVLCDGAGGQAPTIDVTPAAPGDGSADALHSHGRFGGALEDEAGG